MFVFDIETLGTHSNSVILSAALVWTDGTETAQELMDKSLMVKFDASEQFKKYKRTSTRDTIDWWQKQGDFQKAASFYVNKDVDLSAEVGLKALRDYVELHHPDKRAPIWVRGSLDQLCIDSLAEDVGTEFIYPYHKYRDVRTGVDILKETSVDGYCDLPEGLLPEGFIAKHHPVHDCILDIMMLTRGL